MNIGEFPDYTPAMHYKAMAKAELIKSINQALRATVDKINDPVTIKRGLETLKEAEHDLARRSGDNQAAIAMLTILVMDKGLLPLEESDRTRLSETKSWLEKTCEVEDALIADLNATRRLLEKRQAEMTIPADRVIN